MENKNLIYGKHSIYEFIKKHPNLIKNIWTTNMDSIFETLDLKINIVTKNKLDRMFQYEVNHQNIVAEVKEYNYQPFSEMKAKLLETNKNIVLIFDQIQDPYNFGALIRTASLLNIQNIVILDRKQVFVTSTVVKTSAGTVYDVNISKVSNLSNVVKELQKQGFWVYSTNLNQNSQDIRNVSFANKSAIIIGNEHSGVSELLTKNSDVNFYIPSNKNIDSFNANVAGSIIMFWVSNQIKLI
ncbi:23S rRNA (guanosine2251-2'-O)-methyltransferase [Entomoplasma ellychniae]|uniref:23S rRNA (Guanosine2251-2'-O)-methyltransferase n=1 Tax=Entomoplasma ellychniae TaxID=2114 RepID=A0A8E2QZU3_9MOLU|nr:23S rRNA (guanosine(2251)-2'-O)-methyltransferase RlmB [Entomoplasma ellychniae]PPE04870.1 23S rRNA (guanosine2251-2'-O)-methyltransferase [Entomoplasma ellychniae]